eukprot:TRINITY_DN28448_c0_g1_i1.p1 TRINITY_DN28448_c0_g1~~TRINITY_DN28448_c0_g1_i1.p1  ORF type:complete len:274 (+),score=40.14 TRINITY_DN28448_c0_g1_i1:173-994(+)
MEGGADNEALMVFGGFVVIGVVIFMSIVIAFMGKGETQDERMLRELQRHYSPPCELCGKKGFENKLCRKCEVVAYCSQSCQEAHSDRHNEVCSKLAVIRKKHTTGKSDVSTLAEQQRKNCGTLQGYFIDWGGVSSTAILKDACLYFIKYQHLIPEKALSHLSQQGRGIVLCDVSTERFVKLDEVSTDVRMLYIPAGSIMGPRLALFNCQMIRDYLVSYNPGNSAIVAFTNGLNYIEHTAATCPVVVMSFDKLKAINTFQNLTPSCMISCDSPS